MNKYLLLIMFFCSFSFGQERRVNDICKAAEDDCSLVKAIRLTTFSSISLMDTKEIDSEFKSVIKDHGSDYEVIVPYKTPKWKMFDGKVAPNFNKYQPQEESFIDLTLKEFSLKENSKKIISINAYITMRSKRGIIYWSDFGNPILFYVNDKKELSKKIKQYFECLHSSVFDSKISINKELCDSVFSKNI